MGSKRPSKTSPQLRDRLSAVCDNYLNVQQDILESFVDRGQLHNLTQPTVLLSGKRIPGLKLDHPRQLALMHALVYRAGSQVRLREREAFGEPINQLVQLTCFLEVMKIRGHV